MAEPHWTSYVGTATGIIGTLTGIAGAILGIVSYRRTTQIKRMDSRLDLKKALSEAEANLSALLGLLPYADRSRAAVASATGMSRSGTMEAWEAEYQKDWERLQALRDTLQTFGKDFNGADLSTLESKLAEIHALNLRIQQLTSKYKSTIAADDAERVRIKAQQDRFRTTW